MGLVFRCPRADTHYCDREYCIRAMAGISRPQSLRISMAMLERMVPCDFRGDVGMLRLLFERHDLLGGCGVNSNCFIEVTLGGTHAYCNGKSLE